MIDAGMLNGDYILVHNGLQVSNGDIVVARIQGERATVKRFYEEKGRVRLQPENSTMQPIYVAYNDVEVVGKVIGLMRSY
jgi:repressor LexA